MINTFLFDIDGTLLDTEEANLSALQQMLKKHYQIDKSIDNLEFALGIPAHKIMAELNVPFERAVEHWDNQMPDFQHLVQVYNGIFDTIDALTNAQKILGVVTSESKEEVVKLVYPYQVVQKFPYLITSSDTVKHKPEPDPILKALAVSKSTAESTIYIGDSIYDLKSAKSAGVKFGLARWGAHDRGQFLDADFVFDVPTDILNLLN